MKVKNRIAPPLYTRYLSRRTSGDNPTTLECPVEQSVEGDRTWTFTTIGGVRGTAVLRRTAAQAQRDSFEIHRIAMANADSFRRIEVRRPATAVPV